LRWALKYSPAETAYLKAKNVPLPDMVEPKNLLAWSAYMALRSVNGVSVTDINAWFELTGIDYQGQKMRLARLIMAMDRAEMEIQNGGA